MPDDSRVNAMQANLGLMPGSTSPMGMRTPSPGETSLQLSVQASQQAMQAHQVRGLAAAAGSPIAASTTVGQQFQQQLHGIQAQQSMNPYIAQMMAGGGGQGAYMPSPLTMTPPSTGVFRTPPPGPMSSPVPPIYSPPMMGGPFTPQPPSTMFRSPYEQMVQQQNVQSNRMFSFGSQAPGVAGQALGIGGAAYAGSRVGAAFGPMGRVAGAVGGAALAGFSGLSKGLGNLAQMPMQPMMEARKMGAGIQNMSRNWVVTGSDMSPMGRGLGRDASVDLAGGVKDLASDSSFQDETGGMFNRQDLMQVMKRGGRAGLFDMAQSVPQIQQQLRATAGTIRQFMELTNDPDVSNVIRQMGRLRQFGLSQQEMVSAAQGMRAYSRAAGTSIGGVQQMGGLPGAMTFQQAGLSAGSGFQYGNYAAASSRQMVAGGGINERQLALLGGVQGMTQRDIQGQAAFSSMPLYGAASAQYGEGGWGAKPGGFSQAGQGAFGLVNSAVQNMSKGLQEGGIGALAMFPLQRRMATADAMAEMTPQQMLAQRFEMAQRTGESVGMKGKGAFAFGAQSVFGEEQGEQMLQQASSPEFWRAQQQMVQQQRKELAYNQRAKIMEDSPLFGDVQRQFQFLGRRVGEATGLGRTNLGGGIGEVTSSIGRTFGDITDSIGDTVGDFFSDTGTYKQRLGKDMGAVVGGARKAALRGDASAFGETGIGDMQGEEVKGAYGWNLLRRAQGAQRGSMLRSGEIVGAADLMTWGTASTGVGLGLELGFSSEAVDKGVASMVRKSHRARSIQRDAQKLGGVKKHILGSADAIDEAAGTTGTGYGVLKTAGRLLDQKKQLLGAEGRTLDKDDYYDAMKTALVESGKSEFEAQTIALSLENKPGIHKGLNAQMRYLAREQSEDKSTWLEQEERDASDTFEAIENATEAREEYIEKGMEGLEEELELDAGWFGYSQADSDIQTLAGDVSPKEFSEMALAAAAKFGGEEERKAFNDYVQRTGMSNEKQLELDKKLTKLQAEGGERGADMLRELGQVGGRSKGDADKLTAVAKGYKGKAEQGYLGGGFAQKFGKFSEDYTSYLATAKGGKPIDTKTALGKFTPENLAEMRKSGKAGTDMADLIEKATGGDADALAEVQMKAVSMSGIDMRGKSETALTAPTGKEAKKLDASEEALSNVAAMFADFKPASKDFREGAKLLVEAMEAGGAAGRMREE